MRCFACAQKLAERALKALPGGAATLSALRATLFAAAGVEDHHEHAAELTRCVIRSAGYDCDCHSRMIHAELHLCLFSA
jgi:hypothetical protein